MAEDTEVRFSGAPSTPSPEVFEQAQASNPAWYRVIEQAYMQFAARPENRGIYADIQSRGATIQQTWLMYTLWGTEPYCVLAGSLPENATQRITRLVKVSASELVEALKKVQSRDGKIGAALAYHDGTMGHCITIISYNSEQDRFIYHDPWPERSLLVKEHNAAGVDAQPEGARWSVTSDELVSVAFATFLFPSQWARVQGKGFDYQYSKWIKSEFFEFFRLELLDEDKSADIIERVFAPGAFTDVIALKVKSLHTDKILSASLQLDMDWIVKNSMLAFDLAKSFVSCFAPAPDRAFYFEISEALWNLRDPNFMIAAKDTDPEESNGMRAVHAFMGSVNSAEISSDFAHLSIGGAVRGDAQCRFIKYTLM